MSERTTAMRGLLRQVQHIADTTEDQRAIRALLHEARITPNIHVGVAPEDFTDPMKVEYVLGQWANVLDEDMDYPYLNTCRNISYRAAQELCGYVSPWEAEP